MQYVGVFTIERINKLKHFELHLINKIIQAEKQQQKSLHSGGQLDYSLYMAFVSSCIHYSTS